MRSVGRRFSEVYKGSSYIAKQTEVTVIKHNSVLVTIVTIRAGV